MFKAMLRGLLVHKLRLLLSGLAVVLGTMFMAGAFIGGDTIGQGFENLFVNINRSFDVQVTAKSPVGDQNTVTTFLDQATADRIKSLPGIERAVPQVVADGARVIDRKGKVIPTTGPPRFGIAWNDDPVTNTKLTEGAAPANSGEVALNKTLAGKSGYRVGDRVDVLTLTTRKTFTVSGIFGTTDGKDSQAGEMTVAFAPATAQELMLGQTGLYTNVDIVAAPGQSDTALAQQIQTALGPGYAVKSAEQSAKDQAESTAGFVNFLKVGLTSFAGVGLLTGAFLIFNTFSMLVAQRTRELALYRSFGASKGQVIRSVIAEAVIVALIASILGFLLGMVIGYGLRKLLETFADTDLPVSGITVHPYVPLVTIGVGVLVTVLAALMPALRAARVPPIAAMRDAATPDKPLGLITTVGAVLTGAGLLLLILKLVDALKGHTGLWLGAGATLAFLGVAALAPMLSKPVTRGVGKLFGRSVPGALGARNTGRNPRRTATTAAALMLGVALTTGAGVFASSVRAGINDALSNDTRAQLMIAPDFGGGVQSGFPLTLGDQIKATPGVADVLVMQQDLARVGGKDGPVAAGDVAAAQRIMELKPAGGDLRALRTGEFVVDSDMAKARGWAVGTKVPMQTIRGATSELTLVGVYETAKLFSGILVGPTEAAGFRSPLGQIAFVEVADATQVDAVQARLETLVADNPELQVSTLSALGNQVNSLLNIVLVVLNVLLGLAILIAVLGIINTLLLSIFERTREVGLVRAIGMSRGQVGRMITVESILISVFGALLGMILGTALGILIVKIVEGNSFPIKLSVSWPYLLVTLLAGILVGLIAAILPAIRASHLNVLEAISYE